MQEAGTAAKASIGESFLWLPRANTPFVEQGEAGRVRSLKVFRENSKEKEMILLFLPSEVTLGTNGGWRSLEDRTWRPLGSRFLSWQESPLGYWGALPQPPKG